MSTTYIAVIVNVLAMLFPSVEVDALNITVQTLVTLVTGAWILYERFKRGDVTPFGAYKK